jgi:hypothetical protein
MKRSIATVAALTVFLASTAAFAEAPPPASPAPYAPTAEAAPSAAVAPTGDTRTRVGVALTVVGGFGLVGGVFGTFMTFVANAGSCEDGPCPKAVSTGAQAAAFAGTGLMAGALATGIVLLATGPSRSSTTASRLRPTASGVGFSF